MAYPKPQRKSGVGLRVITIYFEIQEPLQKSQLPDDCSNRLRVTQQEHLSEALRAPSGSRP